MYGGLNETDDRRLIYLHAQSPVGEYFGKIRRCGPVGEGVLLGVRFEVSEAHSRPVSLCLSIRM